MKPGLANDWSYDRAKITYSELWSYYTRNRDVEKMPLHAFHPENIPAHEQGANVVNLWGETCALSNVAPHGLALSQLGQFDSQHPSLLVLFCTSTHSKAFSISFKFSTCISFLPSLFCILYNFLNVFLLCLACIWLQFFKIELACNLLDIDNIAVF